MKYNEIGIGDYVESVGHNPHGDRNLDGQILRGIVIEKTDTHKQLKLHTDWCVHPDMVCNACGDKKCNIVKHIPCNEVVKILHEY